jgi:hypothetical protein
MPASFLAMSTTASSCQKEANRRLQIEIVNFSVKREKNCLILRSVLLQIWETVLVAKNLRLALIKSIYTRFVKQSSTGVCPKNLETRIPGQIDHAGWLTTANRILQLYT